MGAGGIIIGASWRIIMGAALLWGPPPPPWLPLLGTDTVVVVVVRELVVVRCWCRCDAGVWSSAPDDVTAGSAFGSSAPDLLWPRKEQIIH